MRLYGFVLILCSAVLSAEEVHAQLLTKADKDLDIESAIHRFESRPYTTSSLDLLLHEFCGHYSSNQDSLDSVLAFLEEHSSITVSEQGESYAKLITCMHENGRIYNDIKSDVFAVGFSLKKQILKGQEGGHYPAMLENHFAAKALLPECVQLIIFSGTIRFRNIKYGGYLSAQSDQHDSQRRYVRTTGDKYNFNIREKDAGGRTWLIYNTNYDEYFYYGNDHYDSKRGFMFTWIPGDIVCNGVFRFVAETSTDVQIWTKVEPGCGAGQGSSNRPVYAADDKHRWYVLYWLPGDLVDSATWTVST